MNGGDVGLNDLLILCCSHCHCSCQSVMVIGQSWLADDDGYDTSTPYYHSSVYGWYNGFVWWVRFLSTLHFLHREEELRSFGRAPFFASTKKPLLHLKLLQALNMERILANLVITPQWFCPYVKATSFWCVLMLCIYDLSSEGSARWTNIRHPCVAFTVLTSWASSEKWTFLK